MTTWAVLGAPPGKGITHPLDAHPLPVAPPPPAATRLWGHLGCSQPQAGRWHLRGQTEEGRCPSPSGAHTLTGDGAPRCLRRGRGRRDSPLCRAVGRPWRPPSSQLEAGETRRVWL